MDSPRKDVGKIAAALLGAMIGPFLVSSGYFGLFLGMLRWNSPSTDLAAFFLAIALGIVSSYIFMREVDWPSSDLMKTCLLVVYTLASCVFLFRFSFTFVCAIFQECL